MARHTGELLGGAGLFERRPAGAAATATRCLDASESVSEYSAGNDETPA